MWTVSGVCRRRKLLRDIREFLVLCHICRSELFVVSRFFGAFADGVLEKFYASVSDWECRAALKGLTDAKVDPTTPAGSRRSLSDAPPALTYLMLSSTPIMQNPKIMTTLQECTPTSTFSEWPTDIPPVGLLLLLVHDSAAVRSWARNQVATYKTTPMKSEQFLPTYVDVLSQVTKAIGLLDAQLSQVGNANDISKGSFPFTRDPSQLWSGYGNT